MGNKIWFTADKHLNHKNILAYCNRPFETVEEMNAVLINNHNSVVSPEDIVYDLGDFCQGDAKKYLSRLNGNIIRIKGSHDKDIKSPYMMIIQPKGLFDEYKNKRTIVLCHYAMRSWHLSHYGSWHLYGHHHGRLESYGLSADAGVDTNNFYPYSLADIEKKMSLLKPIVDFRGKKGNI